MANVSPKTIVAAMPPNATSNSNGIIPAMVVMAAISTGRVRDTVASTIACCKGMLELRWILISSISTMTFLIIMPNSPSHPAMGKNPKSKPVSSIPTAMPIRESGNTQRMMTGWRKLPNSATRIITRNRNAIGKYFISASIASC